MKTAAKITVFLAVRSCTNDAGCGSCHAVTGHRPKAPSVGGSAAEHHPKGQGSWTAVHCNIHTQVTASQVWQAGQLPGGDREGGEMIPVIFSEQISILPASLASSLGVRQVLAQLGPYRGISCDKGEPPSHMHTVAFTQWHLGIQMLSCYFGVQRSAAFPSAVWKEMHWASSPQIAFLHPPHHKCVLHFGCSSHIRAAFGLDGCRVSVGWSVAGKMASREQMEKGTK